MEPARNGEIELHGLIDRITYQNELDGFTIGRLESSEGKKIRVIGPFLLRCGDHVSITGKWETGSKYGDQFRITSVTPLRPQTREGIIAFLSSGQIKGVGKVFAHKIAGHFGPDTLDIIEKHPERLHEVKGIGCDRIARIIESYRAHASVRDALVFLGSHGIAGALAERIAKRYGKNTIAVLEQNPYGLTSEFPGVGFKTADDIAKKLGLAPDSPERARAAILYSLRQHEKKGHVYALRTSLVAHAANTWGISAEALENAATDLVARRELGQEAHEGGRWLAPKTLHATEIAAANLVRSLLCSRPKYSLSPEVAHNWALGQKDFHASDEQIRALRTLSSEPVAILTGGPGTGKTTIIRGLVEMMTAAGAQVKLASPTGRAAKRLTEATGYEATTLHRLLEFRPGVGFARREDNPVLASLVLVDECSMLDLRLFASLLKALPMGCALILVGDADQLPSVGPGAVLADLIASGIVPVCRLTEIFRQARDSGIVINAHRILHGELPEDMRGSGSRGDFFFVPRPSPEKSYETVLKIVCERLPRAYGIDATAGIQVLCPMHRGTVGAGSMNAGLRQELGRGGPEADFGGRRFRVGDKVMQTRNNYETEVFNGDTGIVTGANASAPAIAVQFGNRVVDYDFQRISELTLAFATTIHKSQGSEYPAVVIPLATQHFVMLKRNLLYTAVTRARQVAVLVGEPRALRLALANASMESRQTLLSWRLRDDAALS